MNPLGLCIVLLQFLPVADAWDNSIQAYRDLLITFSKDVEAWSAKARAVRRWMAAHDPDYPTYHLTAPEGWNNDPNGVTFDSANGLYHRFYQYDKTYSDECMHGRTSNCTFDGKLMPNAQSRTWGHTVSRDGATWEDWPGIDADSEWDAPGVFSGNCVINDDGTPVCIYSNGHCSVGVCAYSTDWIHWRKTGCMTWPPSSQSQTNHDSAIWRDGPSGTWYMLSGGCTFNGTNTPSPGIGCMGNAQLWKSTDLQNFTYVQPITPGGPGAYWELPYLLPFNRDGSAIDNYHHQGADLYALLFGYGNAYYVGTYDSTKFQFTPLGVPYGSGSGKHGSPPSGWPMNKLSDTTSYYSFNPHATDRRGPGNTTRRLMFGWVTGGVSAAVRRKTVPYWQSAHSLMRTITISGRSIAQLPAAGTFEPLRRPGKFTAGPITVRPHSSNELHMQGNYLLALRGDALEIIAVFATNEISASSFGLSLRAGPHFSCKTGYNFKDESIAPLNWKANIKDQPQGQVVLHIFLDRSIIETYTGGAVATSRCLLPAGIDAADAKGVDLWALDGNATLLSLQAWELGSMWQNVPRTSIASVYV